MRVHRPIPTTIPSAMIADRPRTYWMVFVVLQILLGSVLIGVPVAAQDAATSLPYDDSEVSLRTPSDDLAARYQDDPAFQYEERAASEAELPSFLADWIDRFNEWIGRSSIEDQSRLAQAIDIVLWILIIGLVVWFILQLFRMEGNTPWARSPSEWPDEDDASVEGTQTTYLERAQQAHQAGNPRAAVRWYYRAVLYALDRADLITYTPEKTNRAYMRDVQAQGDESLAEDVARVAQTFEYVWYGRFDVSEREVDAVQDAVERVHNRLSPQSSALS